ncbi:MAG: DUF4115 domain-containing protein, partial [Actinomycetota bacterium]|nr:DUF4115 domain-containing protein [Actinomycetota bacterium]
AGTPRPTTPLAAPVAAGGSGTPAAPADRRPPAKQARKTPDRAGDAMASVRRDRVTVGVTVRGSGSWVSVTGARGNTLFRGLLRPAQERVFTDRERVSLVVGNAAAVRLVVNGRRLGAPGRAGEVARLSFTRTDPAAG